MSRTKMLKEYQVWCSLTDKERDWIRQEKFDSFISALYACSPTKKNGGGAHTQKRTDIIVSEAKLLENPPAPLEDTPNWIAYEEERLLGIAISANRVDSCNIDAVNTSCKEYAQGKKGYMVFGVEVQMVREYKIKKGKNKGKPMAYLVISDGTCQLDSVCVFPECFEEYEDLIMQGNMVGILGEKDKKTDSLIVKKMWKI